MTTDLGGSQNDGDRPLRVLLALAPTIFTIHFLEEAPGFVAWFNAHADRDISTRLFWRVNVTALMITTILALVAWLRLSTGVLAVA